MSAIEDPLYILRQQISAPEGELAREVASLLGFGRTGSRVEECVMAGIELLVTSGAALRDAGMIVLPHQ